MTSVFRMKFIYFPQTNVKLYDYDYRIVLSDAF